MRIKSILIANRGEIAVRIIRAAKALSVQTIQAYSEADKDSLAVRLADKAICIGSPIASKSYLNIEVLIDAAVRSGAEAVHPGYGFLSENADFADAVAKAGLIFIGPDGRTIRRLGDKVAARRLANEIGVPTVPGSEGKLQDLAQALSVAEQIGYPVMVKALAGGGGKGIRIAKNEEELASIYPQASNEAKAVFGDGGLYLEKYIQNARHLEVQLLGDGENVVHCYERECSIQRRRQKIWEEAPAVNLKASVRDAMCQSAVSLLKEVGYCGAATVEYVYDNDTERFYFIETNTRIQVEHPVTEMITGIDLIAEMIKIASGMPLSVEQQEINVTGHAIECRINAEDPKNNFMPSPGKATKLLIPKKEGVRFDTFLYEGYTVPMYYDSLIGKLIVHGADREKAMTKLHQALSELHIEGIKTTIPLHLALTTNPSVVEGKVNTRFLEAMLEKEAVIE